MDIDGLNAGAESLEMAESGTVGHWGSDPRIATIALSRLAKRGEANEVSRLLDKLLHSGLQLDVVHWGAASRAFELENQWRQSISMVQLGRTLEIPPNEFLFSSAVSSCARNEAWSMGLNLVSEGSHRCGINEFMNVGAISACHHWDFAVHLLEMTCDLHLQPGQVAFGATIGACSKADHWRAAESLLQSMWDVPRTLVAVNSCCAACAGARRWRKSLTHLHLMPVLALQPNLISFNSSMAACEKGYEWERGLMILASMEVAQVVPEIISFGSAISACEKGGQWQLALHLLRRMSARHLRADAVALSAAMSACEKAGEWQTALALLQPTLETSRTSRDRGCAFSAALGAAEHGMAWAMALALFKRALEERVSASGMYAGAVASAIRKARGKEAAVDFLKCSRHLWEDGPHEARRPLPGLLWSRVEILGKASGLVVVSKAANVRTEKLVDAACKQMQEELFVVSRLDRPTSGLLPLATSLQAMNWLQAQFAARLVYKEYVCLCEGKSLGDIGAEGTIDKPLRSWIWPGEVGRTEVASFGREAVTDYRVVERFGAGPSELMLLSVHPRTGRMHQIRAHLASINRPIVGDEIYGVEFPSAIDCDRMFLHCRHQRFLDFAASPFEVTAELPSELQDVLVKLRQSRRDTASDPSGSEGPGSLETRQGKSTCTRFK